MNHEPEVDIGPAGGLIIHDKNESTRQSVDTESGPEFDLEHFLPYLMSRLTSRMSRRLERRYGGKYGLSVPEWRILLHLSKTDSIGMNELNLKVEMHKSRVSRAAQKLVRAGYITRHADGNDRRRIGLELTQEGRVLVGELLPLAGQFQSELDSSLGEHRRSFMLGLKTLMESSPK